VEYGNLIAPVIEAIREVYTQVTSQRQQLDYMKAVNRQQAEKIHDLEARLERVEMMLSQEKR
jgi:cell division protein FtsB